MRLPNLVARYRGRSVSRGQALVELALILPVLLLLFGATLDLGRMFYSQITIANAAREGAMEAAQNPTSFLAGTECTTANRNQNRVMCRVQNEAKGSFVTIAPSEVKLDCVGACAAGLGNKVQVEVRGSFSLLTPILSMFTGGQTFTMSSVAIAQIATAPVGGVASTPTPDPSATPTPTPDPSEPSPEPSASAEPVCHAPEAKFSVSPTSGFRHRNENFPGTTFSFTDQSTNTDAACSPVWSWNFGDGSGTSSLQHPNYVYKSSKTNPGFTVTLVVSNAAGNSTASTIVRVDN